MVDGRSSVPVPAPQKTMPRRARAPSGRHPYEPLSRRRALTNCDPGGRAPGWRCFGEPRLRRPRPCLAALRRAALPVTAPPAPRPGELRPWRPRPWLPSPASCASGGHTHGWRRSGEPRPRRPSPGNGALGEPRPCALCRAWAEPVICVPWVPHVVGEAKINYFSAFF